MTPTQSEHGAAHELDVLVTAAQFIDEMTEDKAEAYGVKFLHEPVTGEKVIGRITSPIAKRTFAASYFIQNRGREIIAQAQNEMNLSRARELESEAARLHRYAELLENMYRLQVCHDLSVYDIDNLGTRKNWQIVSFVSDQPKQSLKRMYALEV